jgi:hypothetical protein
MPPTAGARQAQDEREKSAPTRHITTGSVAHAPPHTLRLPARATLTLSAAALADTPSNSRQRLRSKAIIVETSLSDHPRGVKKDPDKNSGERPSTQPMRTPTIAPISLACCGRNEGGLSASLYVLSFNEGGGRNGHAQMGELRAVQCLHALLPRSASATWALESNAVPTRSTLTSVSSAGCSPTRQRGIEPADLTHAWQWAHVFTSLFPFFSDLSDRHDRLILGQLGVPHEGQPAHGLLRKGVGEEGQRGRGRMGGWRGARLQAAACAGERDPH